MKKILITGGTSLIGKSLINDLKFFYELHLIKRSKMYKKVKNKNIVTYFLNTSSHKKIYDIFKRENFFCVIHLASNTKKIHNQSDIKPMIDSNLIFGSYILDAMSKNKSKYFINVGTYWQFYKKESAVNFYSATKNAFQEIINYYTDKYNLTSISLILFDVYSPNDNRKKIFQIVSENANKNKKTFLSTGNQKMRLLHISDVVQAFKVALKVISQKKLSNRHSIFYLTCKTFSLKKIIDIFASKKKINKKLLIWGALKLKNIIYNPACGKKLPNWRAKISLNKMFE